MRYSVEPGKGCARMFSELTPKEQQKIRDALASPKPLKVVHLESWTDDHLPCVGTRINGVLMGFWWLSIECAGATVYSHDKKAQAMIRKMIQWQIDDHEEENDG